MQKNPQNNRKSGLKSLNPELQEQEKTPELNFEETLTDFQEFEREYKFLLNKKKKKAYIVTFVDEPTLAFITFETNRDKAKWKAISYFQQVNPKFEYLTEKGNKFVRSRRKRIPQFDKYADTEKIPIKELLQAGMSFSCGACGKGNFNYSDIKVNNGYIVEDGFEVNPFTKGIILCPRCYKKYYR